MSDPLIESEDSLPMRFMWHPNREIVADEGLHHTEMIWKNPGIFGISPEEIQKSRKLHTIYPPYDGVLIQKIFDQGWVRVSRAMSDFTIEAKMIREVFECAVWCANQQSMERLYMDAEYKHESLSGNSLERFLRTGRIIRNPLREKVIGEDFVCLENPTADEVIGWCKKYNGLRGLTMDDNVFVWDAHDAIHGEGGINLNELGIEGTIGVYFVFMGNPQTAKVRGEENMMDDYWVANAQPMGSVWYAQDAPKEGFYNQRLHFLLESLKRKTRHFVPETVWDSIINRSLVEHRTKPTKSFVRPTRPVHEPVETKTFLEEYLEL